MTEETIINGIKIDIPEPDGDWYARQLAGQRPELVVDEYHDVVNHPSHYTDGGIEVIDVIEAKGLGYHLGNAVKYILRAGKKDPEKTVEDLRKAVWYIERYIKRLEVDHV